MLNFLAQEDQQTLQRESQLLNKESSPKRRSTQSSSKVRRKQTSQQQPYRQKQQQQLQHQLFSDSLSQSFSRQHTPHYQHENQYRLQSPPPPEGFFPDLGLSWRDPRRKIGRDWLRREKLNREQRHHKKILKVMRNVVYEPKKKKEVDIWNDPTIKNRAIEWYKKEQEALANGSKMIQPKIKEVNWFVQMQEDNKPPTPRKKYVPPPPKPPPGPHHPRMLVPVPAVAAEPVAHIASTKRVMNAIVRREYYYKLLERTVLMSRAKGVQYLGGPNRLMKKYFELFRHILVETIEVGRSIEEWRFQLSLLTKKRVPYHKKSATSIRPAFMWGGETVTAKGHKRRYYKNYIIKMSSDLQYLIKTEIPAKMGKGSNILIEKANISGNYVKGIEVCPLLLPFTLEEILDPTIVTKPTLSGVGLPSDQFYGCSVEDVNFIALLIVEERQHKDVQGKLFVNPESVKGFEEMTIKERSKLIEREDTYNRNLIDNVSKTSTFGPSIRASVESVGSVQLKVAKELKKRSNLHLTRTFTS
jgi:hypothetical protein